MSHRILASVAAAALIAGAQLTGQPAAAAGTVTVASWGGSYQDAQSKALFEPVAADTGIEVKQETYGGMSDVRLQVNTGAVTLDVVVSGSGSAARAAAEGLLEELDYSIIDVSEFIPGLYTDYCVGSDVFSTVYAWNTEKFGEDGPQSWADFWDVEKFPGTRAYRGKVAGALEPALMADGVPPEEVYDVLSSEEGIERALDKIRELKPHIAVFWTSGAQHALLLALSAITEPGDLILAEGLTYPGMNSLARFLRVRIQGVAMDQHGLRPDALSEACRRGSPTALYITPTVQNPTATIMPEQRRREVAAIAAEHRIPIIEDEIYTFLVAAPPPPVAAFAGDHTFRVSSLSKCVAPGLRVGYLRVPPNFMDAVAAGLMTTTIMASPFTAEIAATLIESGADERIVAHQRVQVAARQALARRLLGDHIAPAAQPESLHLWLNLPEPWRAEEFAGQARARGVLIASSELFAVGRSAAPHAIRLSVGAPESIDQLQSALTILAELLATAPPLSVARL
ncbi:MAG: aminotransferase class I/II-fold pyridoxal phosphate-dependent enzyme [Myxococcota bacterium]